MALLILFHSLSRQVQIGLWRFAIFLDETVQQHDFAIMDHKKRSRDFAFQAGPYLPQSAAKGIHQWFANGPRKLGRQDVLANALSLLLRQFSKPVSDRLIAGLGLKEHDR